MNGMVRLCVERGDFDLRGYEVIRTQFFASASITSVAFSCDCVRFTSACVRKFGGIERVEMLVHPERRLVAVRPCPNDHKNAMRWARIQDDEVSVRAVSGAAFLKTLYKLFGWDIALRYRLRGVILRNGVETAVLFDAKKPEVYFSRYDMRIPWAASGFGTDYYSYRNSRLCFDVPLYEMFAEYNNEPGLQPTKPEEIYENVRCFIEGIRKDRGDYGDRTDILY